MAAIQEHSVIQQERTRANEKCRGSCQVRLWYPMSGGGGGGLNVTRTLQKSATKPDSQLILVIVHDWHSERGVHWTLRLIHVDARGHSAAIETSASVNTREEQVRSDEMNETRLKTTSRPGWSCENILYLFMTRNKPQ
jgi:hypothetical protein